VTHGGQQDPTHEPPPHGIDPRIVDRLSRLSSRPQVFFTRAHEIIDVDVSAVMRKIEPLSLAQTAIALERYQEFEFPLVRTSAREPLDSPNVRLQFKAFMFSTSALLQPSPLRLVDDDAWTASWWLAPGTESEDFEIFSGTIYCKPLEEDRVYVRYQLRVQSRYAPPEWLMALFVDTLGRKVSRDALRAIIRAAARDEDLRLRLHKEKEEKRAPRDLPPR
jgi:hypothetical protein